MRIKNLEQDGTKTSFVVEMADSAMTIYFTVPEEIPTSTSGDFGLSATLLPAMALGESLATTGSVSNRLHLASDQIQDIFLSWDRSLRPKHAKYQRSHITTNPGNEYSGTPDRGRACFFSGGVDSFYSVVKHRDEIDTLIFVHGFDIELENTELLSKVSARLADAAADMGLPLLEIRTNLRQLGEDTGVYWEDYHGAALATVALLLAPAFSSVLIPSSWGYAHLKAWGSHPLVDPLWSTEQVEIIHDGAEANRLGKMRAIANEPAAQKHLRVCWHNPDSAYNCGHCDKCIRTAVAAQIAGAGDRFTTLPQPSLATVARLPISGGSEVTWRDYHDDLLRTNERPDLRLAISLALARRPATAALQRERMRIRWAREHPREVAHRLTQVARHGVERATGIRL